MPWSRNQKAFRVKVYLSSKSYKCVRKEFQRTFKQFKSPSKSLIYYWVQKFENDGTVHNLNSKASGGSYSGRPVTARTPQKIGAVQDSAKDNPKKSIRKRGQELSISRSSLQRILTLDLKLRAYHIQLKQLLTQDDRTKRLQMCQWFLETMIRTFWNMCGLAMKPTFIWTVAWIARTAFTGENMPLMKFWRNHFIQRNVPLGLLFQATGLSDLCGLKMSLDRPKQLTQTATCRYWIHSGESWI